MAIHRLEIDSEQNVESIATSFALFASAVFNDHFPGEERQAEWKDAMIALVRVLNEHVRTMDDEDRGLDE